VRHLFYIICAKDKHKTTSKER